MKKLGRILVLVLSLALIASVIAVVASAEVKTDAPFIIDGAGYGDESTTLADAIAYAEGKLIKLNKDVEVSAAIALKTDLHLDLNGHKVTDTRDNSAGTNNVFTTTKDNLNFTIEGEGSFVGIGVLFRFFSDAKGTTLNLKGYGNGITIKNESTAGTKNTASIILRLDRGNNLNITGKLTFVPKSYFTHFIDIGHVNCDYASTVNIKGAEITVTEPGDAEDFKWINAGNAIAPYLMNVKGGTTVNVEGSVIEMQHGNGFIFPEGKSNNQIIYVNVIASQEGANKGQVTSRAEGVSAPVMTAWVNVNNSVIAAKNSGCSHAYAYNASGKLFNVGSAPVEIRVSNSDLEGASRAISGPAPRDWTRATMAKLYFTNVNYDIGYVNQEAVWLFEDRLNVQWNGGTIDMETWKLSSAKYTITGMADANPDPFGENVKAYVIAEAVAKAEAEGKTLTDAEKEAAFRAFYDKYYDNGYTDGAGYLVESTLTDGKYTYKYYALDKKGTYTEITYGAFVYSELDDGDWYGVKFANVYFVGAPTANKSNPAGAVTYLADGNVYTNVKAKDGKVYASAILTEERLDADRYDPYFSVFNPTTEWYGYPDGTDFPEIYPVDPKSISMYNSDYGTGALVVGQNGKNGYFKYSIAKGETDGDANNPYLEADIGAYRNTSYYTPSIDEEGNLVVANPTYNYAFTDYKYVVQEFDLATESVYMGFHINLIARYATLKATKNGESYTYTTDSSSKTAHSGLFLDFEALSGKLDVYGDESDVKNGYSIVEKASTMPSLLTDGAWNRITLVFENVGWEDPREYTLGEYTRTEEYLHAKLHVYVNGEWAATIDNIFEKYVDSDLKCSVVIDAMRFQPRCDAAESSLLIDNPRVSYYKTNVNGYAFVAAAMQNPKQSIIGNGEFYALPQNPIGSVDGIYYYTEDSLIAAIKDGAHVELTESLKKPLVVNREFTLDFNGNTIPAIYSETHTILRYNGSIATREALACEKIKVELENAEFDISASLNATVGSEIILPDSAKPSGKETVFKSEGGSVFYADFEGWSLENDGSVDAKLVLTDSLAYTVSGSSVSFKPVAIISRGEAASYVFLDVFGNVASEKFYVIPGEDVYPEIPEGFSVESYKDESGWYEVAFISWDNALATKISESKNYELMPNVETRIPEHGIPGIKLNLSLYTDFELNIYIPTVESDNISNVKFTSDSGLSVPVESRGEVVIDGKTYVKYFDRYGTADANINNYYISFEANGKTLVQTINYGIPSYVAAVMTESDNVIGLTSKKLVMNMANYAVKVLELAGADMTKGGAYYYKKLLDKYGNDSYSYLDAYKNLNRNDFVDPESTIYKEQIASLSYKGELSSYIKNASFLFSTETPVFVFEYSDAAKALGIGAPKNLFCDPTAGGVYVLFGYGNETKNPVRHLAYNGGIIGGTDVTGTDVWGANTSAAISYYAYGDSYRYVDASAGGYHSAYNLLSPVTVDVMEGNTKLASGTYSLAAYINALLENNDTDYIDAACALYSYALVAEDFKKNGAGIVADTELYSSMQSVLLIGQSNMVGIGDVKTVEPVDDNRIFMLRNDQWVKMKEPLHTNSTRAGVGIGGSFSKAFVETFDCQLGLIPAAEGATTVEMWAVGGRLYNEAIRLAKIAQQDSEICAILWHQGEGNQNSTDYAEKLQVIFDAMIEELGLDPNKIVIVTGELFGTRSDAVHRPELEDLGKNYPHYGIASSDGLTTVDPQTHFDAHSMRVFGYRYFDIFYNEVCGKHYDFIDDPLHYLLPVDYTRDEYIADYNFNEETTGTPSSVSGIISYAPQQGAITVVEDTATEKYLKIENAPTKEGSSSYCRPFFDLYGAAPAGTIVVVEAKLKLDSLDEIAKSQVFKLLTSASGTTVSYTALCIDEEGYLYNVLGDQSSKGPCDEFRFKLDHMEWTPVKVVINMQKNTKSVYINNQLVLENVQFLSKADESFAPTQVRMLHIETMEKKGSLCIDDCKISIAPFFEVDFNALETGTVSGNDIGGELTLSNASSSSYASVDEENVYDKCLKIVGGSDLEKVFSDVKNTDAKNTVKSLKKFVMNVDVFIEEGSTLAFDLAKPTITYGSSSTSGSLTSVMIYGDTLYNTDSGTLGAEICKLETGKWINIEVVMDFENNTKSIRINGSELVADYPLFDANKYTNIRITGLRIYHLRASGEGSVCLDNLKLYYQ